MTALRSPKGYFARARVDTYILPCRSSIDTWRIRVPFSGTAFTFYINQDIDISLLICINLHRLVAQTSSAQIIVSGRKTIIILRIRDWKRNEQCAHERVAHFLRIVEAKNIVNRKMVSRLESSRTGWSRINRSRIKPMAVKGPRRTSTRWVGGTGGWDRRRTEAVYMATWLKAHPPSRIDRWL